MEKYVFEEVDSVIQYQHTQEDFIDFFFRQNIIPHKFSQIGPTIAQGDLNGDGVADLLIGATNTLPTTAMIREGDSFVGLDLEGLTINKPNSESDLAILDLDLDGDNDVVALSGGYENNDERAYEHFTYINDGGSFQAQKLPIKGFSASVVRPFDYDHDGDPDLFIGARIKKDAYPLAADSWILINESGQFTEENALAFNLGMVTDATWSDYDGDGWEDLVIAREWNSVAILKNKEGKGLSSELLPEIEAKHGLWFSVASADFDQDGDIDFILGNLGNNHRFHASDPYPMRIHAVDVDMNGTLDPITTAYWENEEGEMTEYPINYLDELVAQISVITKKYSDYKSFSYATINDILDPSVMERELYEFRVNTTSSYILWNEGGSFRWQELPPMAQVSPIRQIVVRDLNGDNLPDAILAGNDYTFDVSTGYFDANKGLVLMSENNVALASLQSSEETGLVLQGMAESLFFLDNSSILVAGFNRQPIKTFLIKE